MIKAIKYVLIVMAALVLAMMLMVAGRAIMDRQVDYEVDLGVTAVPKFRELTLPYANGNDGKASLPFLASAIIDIDGDGREELFLGGGHGQADGLMRFDGEAFRAIEDVAGIVKEAGDASHGAVVLDVDKDGSQDLIVARESGVWLHENQGGGFAGRRLDLDLRDDTHPLSVAVADLNGDGHFDMYVSGYIRNDLVEGLNMLLSVILQPLHSGRLFLAGWLPVFLLALSGTALELFGRATCPRNPSDVPMCFYSLGVAGAILLAFLPARYTSSPARNA